jgi:hypothetical protein
MATTPIKTRFSYTIKDFYGFLRKDLKKDNRKPMLSYKNYRGLMNDFFMAIGRHIIKGHCFVLPQRLGTITVIKNRHANVIDYQKSREHKKTIFFMTPHTHGDYFQFRWIKTGNFNNRPFYQFKPLSGANAKKMGIGNPGLGDYILKVSHDPLAKSYPRK